MRNVITEEKKEQMEIDPVIKDDKEIQEEGKEEKETEEGKKAKENEVEMDEESKLDTRKKARAEGKERDRKEVEGKEPKTPVSLLSDRPVRERKPVERLVASIEKDSGRKFQIKKGRGTALKDIPNVSYKLSQRKVGDDTLKLLHTIFFGRIAKAALVKINISKFSGFVSSENEEKQKVKIKEKLDKCLKEKLVEFCDVLDIPIAKADGRKDLVVKLVDFLMAPEATTTEVLAEKEQLSKGEKHKRTAKGSGSESVGSLSKHSAKSHTKKKDDEEDEQKDEEEEEYVNGVPGKSKNEVSDPFETEEENDDMDEDYSEDEKLKKKRRLKKTSAKKESTEKTKAKKTTPKKSSLQTKSSSKHRKIDDDSSDTSPKTVSRNEKTDNGKEKASTPKQRTSDEKSGRKVVRGKDTLKEEKLKPSDAILRKAIRKILAEVDFNKATFTDVLEKLTVKYKCDITPRKSWIKQMIKDEITKLAEEIDDDNHIMDEEDKAENKRENPFN